MKDAYAGTRRWIRWFARFHAWGYEASGGRWSRLGGHPMLLLYSVGHKSGELRKTPLLYMADGDEFVIVASFYGSPGHPAWYRNLLAKPECEVRVGRRRFQAQARTADAEERARLWPKLLECYADYASYQERTDREIPVVVLSPAGGAAPGT